MKKWLMFVPVVAVVCLGLFGWFVLPDYVVIQFGLDGQVSNRLPKVFAVIIPVVLTIIGSIIAVKSDEKWSKGFAVSLIGVVIMVMTLIFNR